MGNCLASNKPSEPIKGKFVRKGLKELKNNYVIDDNTKVLGSGAFGKVFLSHNKHNKSHQVAIKVLNMVKL
jgi:hypothetical protein